MYKVKLLVIGPCECGKTVISNFLADATETISNDYHPTQGVRFENCWPALMKDANGVIFVYSADIANIRKEMDMWYANFVQAQGLKDSQCIVFCHRKPNLPETRSSELSSLFSRITWIQTNIEENGNALRREFNSFLQRLLSNISERRDQEELSILNQH
ncbi:intraflagellar transport protein 22 homolog isoform X2 [Stegodyphus dumicola]|uniref:intraflagellar transport protein 22 homolog isoform X2 n=1 Tax=Stegodyphus dumicola TaxID=202533 RepID=UPI0015B02EEB|nr:intraflagellar transport protein 22 homolog isoform X2 [Stegodyphus dumicola]